jgi:chemotaxis protein methyltransferase CheR
LQIFHSYSKYLIGKIFANLEIRFFDNIFNNTLIYRTDISEPILLRAKEAQYSQLEIQRGLPSAYMVKYFTKNDQNRWTASSLLTKHTEFRKQNLLELFMFTKPFHVIFCRNVLIYQTVESKKKILSRLTEMLVPGGFLILGSGESMLGLSSDYQQKPSDGAILYQKNEQLLKVAA